MTELIQLSEAEITEVAGGADPRTSQSISISATQSNTSTITQSATATNSGAVTATASGAGAVAAAVGAQATNFAAVSQTNAIVAANIFRRGSSGG
jgi:hypothetical protein